MKKVEPTTVRVGDLVTVHGTGLDQVAAVLIGLKTPALIEKTESKIVIRVPYDEKNPDGYEAALHFVAPGHPIASSEVSLTVSPASRAAVPTPVRIESRVRVVERTVSVGATAPQRLEFDAGDGKGIRIEVRTEAGDVEVRLETKGGDPDQATVRATYAGRLDWRVNPDDLRAAAPGTRPLTAVLTLAGDAAEPIPVQIVVEVPKSTAAVGKEVPAAKSEAPRAAPTQRPRAGAGKSGKS